MGGLGGRFLTMGSPTRFLLCNKLSWAARGKRSLRMEFRYWSGLLRRLLLAVGMHGAPANPCKNTGCRLKGGRGEGKVDDRHSGQSCKSSPYPLAYPQGQNNAICFVTRLMALFRYLSK